MSLHTDSSAGNSEHSVANGEVRRFESPSVYQFRWAEEVNCQTGVYLRRWFVRTPYFTVRLHHWLHSDDERYLHDHTWWFITFVLKGGYTDVSDKGNEHLKAGSIRYRAATHKHSVKVDTEGAWTLLITGPKIRNWGFWIGNKWKKSNKYFLEHGIHICD